MLRVLWFCKKLRPPVAPLKIISSKRYLESRKAKLRLSGEETKAGTSADDATDLDVLLGRRQVFGVLQELSHVGHDGLLVWIPDVHICIHITILHDASQKNDSPAVSGRVFSRLENGDGRFLSAREVTEQKETSGGFIKQAAGESADRGRHAARPQAGWARLSHGCALSHSHGSHSSAAAPHEEDQNTEPAFMQPGTNGADQLGMTNKLIQPETHHQPHHRRCHALGL